MMYTKIQSAYLHITNSVFFAAVIAKPSILADHCKMHNYQLEGLNWLIKLHCNGLNGILADEVSKIFPSGCCLLLDLFFDPFKIVHLNYHLFQQN